MALKISPGPLAEDGSRINVAAVLEAFVEGTVISNIDASGLAGGDAALVITQTDAPATDSRTRATLWFARGEGALYKWTGIPTPTAISDSINLHKLINWPISEFRWVQLSGTKREYLQHHNSERTSEFYVMQPTTRLTEPRHVRSDDNQYMFTLQGNRGQASSLGNNFVMDPVMVAPTDLGVPTGSVEAYVDFGFVRALSRGPNTDPFLLLGDLNSTEPVVFLATTYSSAGPEGTICALRSESASTSGEHISTIFLRPQITNLLHGDVTP